MAVTPESAPHECRNHHPADGSQRTGDGVDLVDVSTGDGVADGLPLGCGATVVGTGRLAGGAGAFDGLLDGLDGAGGLLPAMEAGTGRTSR
jgi:hypothetical protein